MVQRRSRKERRKRQLASNVAQPVEMSFWAVAFLDLLGYREVLAGVDKFPLPQDPLELRRLQDSFSRSVRLRRRLVDGVRRIVARQNGQDPPQFRALPPEFKTIAEGWSHVRLFDMPGPDHIVFGCSLAPTGHHFPIRGAHSLMFTAAATMLMQLWIGADEVEDTRPIRGGIDVALGSLLEPDGVLYSPALSRAYELESSVATYPRTLVGPQFVDAMREAAASGGSIEADAVAEVARRVQAMMFEDHDGKVVLDFLGEEVRQALKT